MSYDVLIVGAGPAGSTLGYHLAQTGIKVLIVDRVPFPRYRIGESLTLEAVLLDEGRGCHRDPGIGPATLRL